MTRHLTEAELALTVDGDAAPQALRHVSECAKCYTRLIELQTSFAAFARAREEALGPAGIAPAQHERLRERLAARKAGRPPWRWTVAAVASLLLVWAASDALGPAAPTAAAVPDPGLTPGAVTAAGPAELCAADPDALAAPVPRARALRVFRAYGTPDPAPGAYELDFLIPPELGGSADSRNLWPQLYDAQPWNAHAKDALEARLRRLVCDGELPLADAQRELAEDWPSAYRRRFGTTEPLPVHAAFLKDRPWE